MPVASLDKLRQSSGRTGRVPRLSELRQRTARGVTGGRRQQEIEQEASRNFERLVQNIESNRRQTLTPEERERQVDQAISDVKQQVEQEAQERGVNLDESRKRQVALASLRFRDESEDELEFYTDIEEESITGGVTTPAIQTKGGGADPFEIGSNIIESTATGRAVKNITGRLVSGVSELAAKEAGKAIRGGREGVERVFETRPGSRERIKTAVKELVIDPATTTTKAGRFLIQGALQDVASLRKTVFGRGESDPSGIVQGFKAPGETMEEARERLFGSREAVRPLFGTLNEGAQEEIARQGGSETEQAISGFVLASLGTGLITADLFGLGPEDLVPTNRVLREAPKITDVDGVKRLLREEFPDADDIGLDALAEPIAKANTKKQVRDIFEGVQSSQTAIEKARGSADIEQFRKQLSSREQRTISNRLKVSDEEFFQAARQVDIPEPQIVRNLEGQAREIARQSPELVEEARRFDTPEEFVKSETGLEIKQVRISSLPERATAIGMGREDFNIRADSIRREGVKNPIVIQEGTGEVMDGMRRAFVSERLGLETIPAVTTPLNNVEEARKINEEISQLTDFYNQVKQAEITTRPATDVAISTGQGKNRPVNIKDDTQQFATKEEYVNEHPDNPVTPQDRAETTRRISGITENGTHVASEVLDEVPPIENTPKRAADFARENEPDFEIPDDTLGAYLQRQIQDKMARIGKIEDAIRKTGKEIPQSEQVSLQQEVFIGRASERIDNLRRQMIKAKPADKQKAFLERMVDEDVDFEDFGLYLHARHAQERNAKVNEVTNGEIPDGGSGMTNQRADEIISRLRNENKLENIDRFAQEFDATAISGMRQLMKESGLESQDLVDTLVNSYEHYVPLKIPESKGISVGKGFSVGGKNVHRVRGSTAERMNPFVQALTDYERLLVKAEKNKVAKSLKRLAEENPNDDLWKVERLRFTPRFDKNGEVVGMDPRFKFADNVMEVRENGKIFLLTIKDKPLAQAMKNMGTERASKFMIKTNAYLRGVITYYNPEFMISNFERDFQFALARVAGENGIKRAGQVAANTPSAMKGVWKNVRGTDDFIDSKGVNWSKLHQEFKEEGGRVGFFDQREVEDVLNDLQKKVNTWGKNTNGAKAKQWLSSLGEFVGNSNETAETAVRLSAYKAARDAGLTKAKSAQLAKNLTVNFNKKGNLGLFINSAYLFANAGIQGTTIMLRSLKYPTFRKIALGITASSYGMAEMNRAIAGDEYDKFQSFERHNNWIVMFPNGNRVKIPAPYGLNFFKGLGDITYDQVHGLKTPAESIKDVFLLADNAFNPLSSGTIAQLVSPTILDPIIQLAENKNFFGGPIKPQEPVFAPGKPESQRYWGTARQPSIEVAQFLNRATGGSITESGLVDVSPETIDHITDFLGGGVARFVGNTVHTVATISQGELPEAQNIPFVRRNFATPFEGFERNKMAEIEEISETKQLSPRQLEILRNVMRDGISDGEFDVETARRTFKNVMRNQARITAGGVFEEIKNSSKEEKIKAFKSLSSEERKELIKIMEEQARE